MFRHRIEDEIKQLPNLNNISSVKKYLRLFRLMFPVSLVNDQLI